MANRFPDNLKHFLLLLPAIAAYLYLAKQLDFIQDDAYISYRYAANYLNGLGLVFNAGEYIEGFTNFAWVIYTILLGAFHLDYVMITRLTGLILGGGTIYLTFLIGLKVFTQNKTWLALLPAYIVSVSWALAYWAPAGLETGAFAFLAVLSLYLYLRQSYLLIIALALAVLTRPEGAVVTGLIIIIDFILNRRVPRFALQCAAIAFVISLPFVFFKLFYYGGILPNPFYAKTGLSWEHLKNGFEYVGLFFSQYGFYGIGYLLPIIFYKKLNRPARAVLLYTLFYIVYIILVGGDVLKVNRFFLPLFGTSAILAIITIDSMTAKLNKKNKLLILFATALALIPLTYYLPMGKTKHFNFYEIMFTRKMQVMAEEMQRSDSTNFSVAVPTIGVFGYKLLGHEIIDMVGLTDSTIARHSEEPIEGMKTTWKETKHNSSYLLRKAPDYILFSTGKKPSAPAERALLLYPQFLDAYRAVGWFYKAYENQKGGVINPAFKRMREITEPIVPTYPVEYVQEYKTALDQYSSGDNRTALVHFEKSIKASPRPYYVYLLYQKAFSHMMLNEHSKAYPLLEQICSQDSLCFEVHRDLYMYAQLSGEQAKSEIHKRWIQKLTPWYWPRIESKVARKVANYRNRRAKPIN